MPKNTAMRVCYRALGFAACFVGLGLGRPDTGIAAVGLALDPASPDWQVCRAAARDVGRSMNIPDHLLAAVSVTETGIQPKGHKHTSPWPWTINVNGRGMRFSTKEEAVRNVRRLRQDGHASIDVGCMQVNLKYHPRAFTGLEEAFDPLANVTYAARFLTRLRARHGEWRAAVRRYHSYERVHHTLYGEKVDTAWARERERARSEPFGQHRPVALASVMPLAAIAAAPPVPIPLIERAGPDPLSARRIIRVPSPTMQISTKLARAPRLRVGTPLPLPRPMPAVRPHAR